MANCGAGGVRCLATGAGNTVTYRIPARSRPAGHLYADLRADAPGGMC